jgi:hypothetical protein
MAEMWIPFSHQTYLFTLIGKVTLLVEGALLWPCGVLTRPRVTMRGAANSEQVSCMVFEGRRE